MSACCQVLLTLLIGGICVAVFFVWRRLGLWSRLGLVHAKSVHFGVGNFWDVIRGRTSMAERLMEIHNELKTQGPCGGFYQFLEPVVMVTDPDLLRSILVQDFDSFHSRGMYHNERDDPLGAHLVFLEGQRWRSLRQKLTPVFTSGKLKAMFWVMDKCARELCDTLDRYVDDKMKNDDGDDKNDERAVVIEVKDLMARYTTDIIGNCAMGVDCNSLADPDAEFRRETQKVFKPRLSLILKMLFASEFKSLAKFLRLKIIDKSAAKFFMRVVKETVEYREKNNVVRNDVMQLLIELKNKGTLDEDKDTQDKPGEGPQTEKQSSEQTTKDQGGSSPTLTIEQVAAQAFVFFVAGFETTSTAMSFLSYELAMNQRVQDGAREEIDRILEKHGGVMSYDAVMEMEYLERCFSESLRKYPILPMLRRVCNAPYPVPGTGGFTIPPGTTVLCSTLGLHRDAAHWPRPDAFDPDRFTERNRAGRHRFAYVPFGEGPRNCIGMRFGLMQARLGMAMLLRRYRLEPCDEGPHQTPLKMALDKKAFVATPEGGVWLKMVQLDVPTMKEQIIDVK